MEIDFSSIYKDKCDELNIKTNRSLFQLIDGATKKGHKVASLDLSYKSIVRLLKK